MELEEHIICKHCSKIFHWRCLSSSQKEALNHIKSRNESIVDQAVKKNIENISFWSCEQCKLCHLCLNQITQSCKYELMTCSKCNRYYHKGCLKVNYEPDGEHLKEK